MVPEPPFGARLTHMNSFLIREGDFAQKTATARRGQALLSVKQVLKSKILLWLYLKAEFGLKFSLHVNSIRILHS